MSARRAGNRVKERGNTLFAAALALGLAGMLAACQSNANAPALNITNAPAAGFENMRAGSEEDFMLNVGRRTYFKEGSAQLDDTARATLDKQAQWLNQYPAWKIKVQGFADDPGGKQQNVDISAKRAEAVMQYLVSRGVDQRRMWSKGYGRDRLVRDCPEIACKSQNRRVISNLREEFES